jgi:hypothetical protein
MALTRIRAQQISDIDYKQAVRVITVTNVTLSGGAPNTVDGVSLLAGDRVLVAGQSTGSQNGLYDVVTLGTGSNGTWARTSDGNQDGEIEAGMIVMVTEGDTYKDSQWKLTTNNPIVIGTTALAFEQNSAYAFGNISANGTAILANATNSTVTLAAGDNITITGNNTTKIITITGAAAAPTAIVSGNSNVAVVSSGGNIAVGVGGTSNIAVFSTAGIDVTGTVSATGNVTAGNLSGTNIIGTLTTAAQTNITSVGTLTSLNSGVISSSGNVTGANILTGGIVSATGNITGGNVNGGANVNAATHTGITVSVSGNVTAGGITLQTGNITGGNLTSFTLVSATSLTGTLTTAAQPNVTSVGTLTSLNSGTISSSGNVTGANILTGGIVSATGNITGGNVLGGANVNATTHTGTTVSVTGNITGGNVNTGGVVSATGNVTTSGNLVLGSNIVDTGALEIITGSNGNITLSPNGSGVIVANKDIRNGQANGIGNIGTTGGFFNTIFAKATSAQYADVAEKYVADRFYPPGTVLEIGGAAEVQATTTYASTKIAGVVSTAPALLMNSSEKDANAVELALLGRVPCRVTGTIRRGDLLTSSDRPGVATVLAAQDYVPGCVIGKALQAHSGGGESLIEVLVGRL